MKIAIIGGGTVGGGVVEMLRRWPQVELKYLVVKDISKSRDFSIPPTCQLTDDFERVLEDSSIEMIVELMGGTESAWKVIQTALSQGKHVVTANKALISKHMNDIELLLGAKSNPPFFLYEAAVCGGIPVINTFLRGLKCDDISAVRGVMNGSTNWMLDQMQTRGVGYADLLGEAKELGYLEADPSADVLGWDARSKLCILARIAFGIALNETEVFCEGIDKVSMKDIEMAQKLRKSIRLVANSWIESTHNIVRAVVMPTMVPIEDPLANLPGATNCVVVKAKHSLNHVMVGSGAGRYPTANSVVSDIIAITNLIDLGAKKGFHPFGQEQLNDRHFDHDIAGKFYLRSNSETDQESIAGCLAAKGIPFESPEPTIFVTGKTSLVELRHAVRPESYAVLMRLL